jgi:hypothetical protein
LTHAGLCQDRVLAGQHDSSACQSPAAFANSAA